MKAAFVICFVFCAINCASGFRYRQEQTSNNEKEVESSTPPQLPLGTEQPMTGTSMDPVEDDTDINGDGSDDDDNDVNGNDDGDDDNEGGNDDDDGDDDDADDGDSGDDDNQGVTDAVDDNEDDFVNVELLPKEAAVDRMNSYDDDGEDVNDDDDDEEDDNDEDDDGPGPHPRPPHAHFCQKDETVQDCMKRAQDLVAGAIKNLTAFEACVTSFTSHVTSDIAKYLRDHKDDDNRTTTFLIRGMSRTEMNAAGIDASLAIFEALRTILGEVSQLGLSDTEVMEHSLGMSAHHACKIVHMTLHRFINLEKHMIPAIYEIMKTTPPTNCTLRSTVMDDFSFVTSVLTALE